MERGTIIIGFEEESLKRSIHLLENCQIKLWKLQRIEKIFRLELLKMQKLKPIQ